MDYLFDTNTISDLYSENSTHFDRINTRLSSLTDEDRVFVSVLTLYELEYGYANAPEKSKSSVKRKIDRMLDDDFETLPIPPEGAGLFGKLKTSLAKQRNMKKEQAKKHTVDVILAVTALQKSCIFVSSDKIYSDIKKFKPELQYQDWSKQ